VQETAKALYEEEIGKRATGVCVCACVHVCGCACGVVGGAASLARVRKALRQREGFV
jgi:hypothetical protein